MSREIKFRAFHPKEGVCYPDKLNELNVSIDAFGQVYFDNMAHEPSWELMQFINNQDNDGNDIYEGDILLVGIGTRFETAGVVRWLSDGWTTGGRNLDPALGKGVHKPGGSRVIGNIYENPELAEHYGI